MSSYSKFNPSTPQEALDFIEFVNKSPSPFHSTFEATQLLRKAGYQEIKERDSWNHGVLQRNGKYFFTRNGSAVIAFAIGGQYRPGNGFSILGAHTDSPCLKLKPISKKDKSSFLEVGCQLYGGGIWHTWFDRDLSVAGRVLIQEGENYKHHLVKVDRPLLRIPTLAIHLDRSANDGFTFNKETQLAPILATEVKSALSGIEKDDNVEADAHHHPVLIRILADELKVKPDQIRDFELALYDTQGANIGGAFNEFIFSPRLDNLEMSYCSIQSLIRAQDLENDSNIRLVGLFDNEEVGSQTINGADSNLLPVTLERLANTQVLGTPDVSPTAFQEAIHKSFFVSADMAHSIHPNYADKHEENHQPVMHKGTVIKVNANQRYATTAVSTLILKELAKKHKIPIQYFVVKNTSPCGSTIGPMLSAKLGIRTVDIGNPQLSMHSIREQSGVDDIKHGIDLLKVFFEEFPALDARITVD